MQIKQLDDSSWALDGDAERLTCTLVAQGWFAYNGKLTRSGTTLRIHPSKLITLVRGDKRHAARELARAAVTSEVTHHV